MKKTIIEPIKLEDTTITSLDVIQITYGETVNLGNYQSMRLDVTVRLKNEENINDAVKRAQEICWEAVVDRLPSAQSSIKEKTAIVDRNVYKRGRPAEEDLEDYVDCNRPFTEIY